MDKGDGNVDDELVDEITQECLELMKEPEKTQAIPAAKVMGTLIGTTSKSQTCVSARSSDCECRSGRGKCVVEDDTASSQDDPGSG